MEEFWSILLIKQYFAACVSVLAPWLVMDNKTVSRWEASPCFNKWFIESFKSNDWFKTADSIETKQVNVESLVHLIRSKTDSFKEWNTVLLYSLNCCIKLLAYLCSRICSDIQKSTLCNEYKNVRGYFFHCLNYKGILMGFIVHWMLLDSQDVFLFVFCKVGDYSILSARLYRLSVHHTHTAQ